MEKKEKLFSEMLNAKLIRLLVLEKQFFLGMLNTRLNTLLLLVLEKKLKNFNKTR